MLFRKDIKKSCEYCLFSERKNTTKFQCSKKGIVTEEDSCLFYKYDPCKRVPVKPKALDFKKYDEEDYSL